MVDPEKYVETAITAAESAGRIQREYVDSSTIQAQKSSGFDFVTEADERAETVMREAIREDHPDHEILGEEGGRTGDSAFQWIIDPVDGTTNYYHDAVGYCSIVALTVDGELQLGVIHDTRDNDTYHAFKGGGAYRNGEPISVSDTSRISHALIGLELYYDFAHEGQYDEVRRVLNEETHGTRTIYCAGIMESRLARGEFDAVVMAGAKPWDIAAGVILAREAGGSVSTVDGERKWTNLRDADELLFSNGSIHDDLQSSFS